MKTEIKVKSNQSERTFTIRKYEGGKLIAKYRTIPLSQDEFDREEMNTENDWKQFLKSDDYYVVR
jgi:endoglucanase Acf2